MELDPETLSTSDRYKIMVGSINPRPIAFVSSLSVDGRLNLAPYSFFNGAGVNPMTLVFSPMTRSDGSDKDTLRNCLPVAEGGTGEFVVNVAVESYARQLAAAAEELPFGQNEFDFAGFTPAASRRVKVPRVGESPVSLECKTLMVIRLGEEPMSGNLVIGEVVHIWIRDDLRNERGHVDPDKLATIGRMGGPWFVRTRQRYEMPYGKAALEKPAPFPEDVGTEDTSE